MTSRPILRQINQIYDCLDNGQEKQAIVLCDKILKKEPHNMQTLALKALALYYSDKIDQCLACCDQVRQGEVTDPATLQPVFRVLSNLHRHKEISSMYATAFKKSATTVEAEELGNHWFMSLSRESEFKSQSQLALQLHKRFSNQKYYYWAIVTYLLQARANESSQELYLSLAERMMQKALTEGKIDNSEEVWLFLDIMEKKSQFEVALNTLDDHFLGRMKYQHELKVKKAQLLLKLNRNPEVIDYCKELLMQGGAQTWQLFELYLEALANIVKCDGSLEPSLINEHELFFDDLLKDNPKAYRSVILAKLRLKLIFLDSSEQVVESSKKLLLDYFDSFGDKECFHLDVEGFLSALFAKSNDHVLQIQALLEARLKESDSLSFKEINYLKIHYQFNFIPDNHDLLLKEAEKLTEKAKAASKDPNLSSKFYALAALLLLEAYSMVEDDQSREILTMAGQTLLDGLSRSDPQSYQLRLLLMRVFILQGNGKKALDSYKSLEVKNIQHETVGHYFTDFVPYLLKASEAQVELQKAIMFYSQNLVDTPEMIISAFKYGSYTKIEEFWRFKGKMDRSLQRQILLRHLFWTQWVQCGTELTSLKSFVKEFPDDVFHYKLDFLDWLMDNRDYSVFPDLPRNPSLKATPSEKRLRPNLLPHFDREFMHEQSMCMFLLRRVISNELGEDWNEALNTCSKYLASLESTAPRHSLLSYFFNLATLFDQINVYKSKGEDDSFPTAQEQIFDSICQCLDKVALDATKKNSLEAQYWDFIYKIMINTTKLFPDLISESGLVKRSALILVKKANARFAKFSWYKK